jgi:putative SOS response-associated peptidase YedK
MLAASPGLDTTPYHDRQIVVLPRDQDLDWLNLSKPDAEILRPLPEGRLTHAQVR